MTPEDIRAALEAAEELPREALAAAVAQAPSLAPVVLDEIDQAASGVHLLPRQENLLLYGLHVLAAARWTGAAPGLRRLLRLPLHDLERLLGDVEAESGAALLLSLHDGDDDALYAMLEDDDVAGTMRWAVFEVLARLVWEGRGSRERFVAFLDRFDREALAQPADPAWEGWQAAIALLGLAEFEDRVRAGWEAGRNPPMNDADGAEWQEALARAVARPEDESRFAEDGIARIDDPVAALEWTDRGLVDDVPDETDADDIDVAEGLADPAAAIALSERELDWLGGFLTGSKAPLGAMTLEQLDGFFAALVAGPEMVPPSEYMGQIWSADADQEPIYDSQEQAEYVLGLLMRHWNTIATRLHAGFEHTPQIESFLPDDAGTEWAAGFARGVMLRFEAWEPLRRDRRCGPLLQSIIALLGNEYGEAKDAISPETRDALLDELPVTLLAINTYWRLPAAARRVPVQARRAKVGRNEPCPCGSGKKFKKCCEGKPVFGTG